MGSVIDHVLSIEEVRQGMKAVTVRAWGRPGLGSTAGAPPVAVRIAWTPVMVLSHDCEIDKEFGSVP